MVLGFEFGRAADLMSTIRGVHAKVKRPRGAGRNEWDTGICGSLCNGWKGKAN
jgi:hypothetical protein